ncbi:MAG: hypothetical protein R3B99_32895 [Polyangiales bacterium]
MSGGPRSGSDLVFEALWAPRWFGLDQGLAHGQEGPFDFRSPVPSRGLVMLAAGLDRPRYGARCRVIGISHPNLGRLQAVEVGKRLYRVVRHDASVVELDAEGGSLLRGLAHAPPDWTVRVTFQVLDELPD